MFKKLVNYIKDTELTILESATTEFETHQYPILELKDVLTHDEIKTIKQAQDDPDTKSYEVYAHPPETHKIQRVRTDIYDIHNISVELQKTIQPIVNKFNLEGLGLPNVSMWKDSPGFEILPHCDQEVLNITMQIYLDNDCDERCGTTFLKPVLESEHGEELLTTPYKKGYGYILLNTNKELHGMMNRVKEGDSRSSLYVVYDKI